MGYETVKRSRCSSPEHRARIKGGQVLRGEQLAARNKARRSAAIADIDSFLGMLSGEKVLYEMLRLIAEKPSELFWPVFLQCWSGCDDTWNFNQMLPPIFGNAGPAIPFLSADARAFFDSLPNEIIVYRGCHRERVRGISWTTDQSIAAGYARGHRRICVPDPVFATALIDKRSIFAVFTDRGESEVLCCPEIIEPVSFTERERHA